MRRDPGRLRVNAQLIDTETGAHLWADQFDEDVADLLKVQDQVVARIGSRFWVRNWSGRRLKKGASSRNPDAASIRPFGDWGPDHCAPIGLPLGRQARDLPPRPGICSSRALQIDPNDFPWRRLEAPETYTWRLITGFGWRDPEDELRSQKCCGQANRAIVLNPANIPAYYTKGYVPIGNGSVAKPLDAPRMSDSPSIPASVLLYMPPGGAENARPLRNGESRRRSGDVA